jgi:YggT family protein
VGIICGLLTLYYIILIVRIVLSWVPSLPEPVQPVARGVYALTDPVLKPVRGLLPPIRSGSMAIDLSPLLVFFGIAILRRVICF